MEELDQVFDFIIEVEKLKSVLRKTRPVGMTRFENSAEHSWHVCICALILQGYSNDDIDIGKVIMMLLVHDIGEIDAGDTIVFDTNPEVKQKEMECVQRVFSMLPENMCGMAMSLWEEFEFGESEDAKFARAIDRVPPILQNVHNHLSSWKEHDISMQQVIDTNLIVAEGSADLWIALKSKIEKAFSREFVN